MEQPNLNYINDLAGDDEAFKAKLISVVKAELPEEIKAYKNTFATGDYTRTAGHVHKLKHKVSILGLEKSYYLAENFENELKDNQTGLASDFENVLTNMENFVAGL